MNWGYKITGLYTGFVLMILTLVTMSMKQDVDLVTPDYYKQEIEFQEKIDKISRMNQLKQKPEWKIIPGTVEITFPKEQAHDIKGSIYFYRPSDKSLDRQFEIKPDQGGKQMINTQNFAGGLYKLEIDWESGEWTYFRESLINI